MKRQILWVVLAVFVVSLAVTFSFSGCTKKEEPVPAKVEEAEEVKEAALTKELKIGYVSMMMAADSNARAYAAFEKSAEANGWKVFLTDAAGDIVKVADGVMNYVAQGVDAIAITCAEITPIKDGLKAAKDANIPVFCMDTGIDEEGAVIANVTSNCWAMGAEVAAQMVNRLHGKGNVCIIDMPTLYVHRYRADTARAVFESADNPGIKILSVDSVTVASWEKGSYDIMTNWITKYGDKIDAVFGTWDGICWNVAKAVADAGFKKENIFAMSIDGTVQTYDMIRKGEPFVGVVAQSFGGWATTTVDLIDAILVQGKSAASVVPESRTIYIPHKWIDNTNVPPVGASPESVFE
jgi:ribose transport system substrate-binding protein